jgi:DMSO/TMAO reductase YedYZ molybdopterin-dependent catalytic subunit
VATVSKRTLDRRTFLLSLAALGVGCDSSRPRDGALGAAERGNLGLEKALFSPTRLAPTARLRDTTSADAFPVYFVSPAVPIAPPLWTLRVRGLVDRPLDLTLDDLMRLTRTDVRVRHHCVEGWSAVTTWNGVRIADLARSAGARSDARFVEFRSFDDGYSSSWDRESAEHPQSLIAYGMNGSPLGPAHGAPARVSAGIKLGYKMVKYLTDVVFLPEATGGYWEDRGYEWFGGV